MPLRPDALFHPLYLSPRRGLDVNPYDAAARKRKTVLDGVRRPVRERDYHVEHLRLDLDLDLARARFTGVARLTLRPIASGLSEVRLDASRLAIGRVTLGRPGGRRLRARHDGETLAVRLDRPYGADETVTLAIAYRARPRRGLWFVRPDRAYPGRVPQAWSQGQAEDSRAWFPCHDHPNDKFTSEIVATVDAGQRVISNGRLVKRVRSRDGRRVTWHWRLDRPHPAYLVSLVVGPFVETRRRAGDVRLAFHALPGQERAARRLYGRTADMVRAFERRFGPYPWDGYSQVAVSEFTWGGMENTTATTLTDKALLDARAALDVSYEELVSHELAHQWWGDLVTCRGWHNNWLNESWATFCETLYEEHARGAGAAAWTRAAKWNSYMAQDLGQYRRPLSFDRYVIPTDLFDRHAYEKGSLVLQVLRDELGDELFFRAARRHLARHAFGFADAHDFRRSFEEESGRDLGWFFEQWVFAAGYPELVVGWRPAGRGRVEVAIRQAQKGGREPHERTPAVFEVGLDVVVVGARGRATHRVRLRRRSERFVLDCPGRPLRVAIDPEGRVLKTLRLAQDAAAWRHALAHDASSLERARAARELAALPRPGAATLRALSEALVVDPARQVRMAAAIALGEAFGGRRAGARGDRARAALTAAAAEGDPHVRRAAVFALGRCGRKAEPALLAVLGRERSYLVKAMALKALAAAGAPGLLDACRAAMDDRGWRDLVPMAALDALAMAKPPAAFDPAYAAVRYGETQEVREAGIRLLVALARDPKARRARREQARHVAPTLAALLDDPSVFVQLEACEAAGKLGDPALLPVLRRLARAEEWDHLQREAGRALRAIEKKRGVRHKAARRHR